MQRGRQVGPLCGSGQAAAEALAFMKCDQLRVNNSSVNCRLPKPCPALSLNNAAGDCSSWSLAAAAYHGALGERSQYIPASLPSLRGPLVLPPQRRNDGPLPEGASAVPRGSPRPDTVRKLAARAAELAVAELPEGQRTAAAAQVQSVLERLVLLEQVYDEEDVEAAEVASSSSEEEEQLEQVQQEPWATQRTMGHIPERWTPEERDRIMRGLLIIMSLPDNWQENPVEELRRARARFGVHEPPPKRRRFPVHPRWLKKP